MEDKNEVVAIVEEIQKPKKVRSQKQQEAFKRCQEKRAENARIRTELKEIKEKERLDDLLVKALAKKKKKKQMMKARKRVKEFKRKQEETDSSESSSDYEPPSPQKKKKKKKKYPDEKTDEKTDESQQVPSFYSTFF